MKKLLSIAVLLISLSVSAQGNLQFNQVINYDMSGASTGGGDVDYQTVALIVPANKVWKIESASCRMERTTSPSYWIEAGNTGNRLLILLDNVPIAHMTRDAFSPQKELPLWLASGSHTMELVGYDADNVTKNVFGKVSIIEFNVVP